MQTLRLSFCMLFLGVICQFPFAPAAYAQSYPSGCAPISTTYECMAVLATPYDYTHNTCGAHEYRASEAESLEDELDDDWGNTCDVSTVRNGWVSAPTTVGLCGIQSTYPKYSWGLEVGNASNYTFTYRNTCTSPLQQQSNFAVLRGRDPFCVQGYLLNNATAPRCRKGVPSHPVCAIDKVDLT